MRELGEVEGGETIIRIYYVQKKKNPPFLIERKKREKEKLIEAVPQLRFLFPRYVKKTTKAN